LPVSGAPDARLLVSEGWSDHALLDSGGGRKLERFGRYRVDRPEPQAMWTRRLPEADWASADAVFVGDSEEGDGRWRFRDAPLEAWKTGYRDVAFWGRFTPFRHVGFFPEQAPHWDWMLERLAGRERPRLLNLFGYTGVASLLAAKAGAEVTHVDASKKAVGFARENQGLAGLEDAPIRWIVDDAVKFAAREGRRGRVYDGILVDPPKFGRGPKNETWQLFENLPEMLALCRDILAPERAFLILTAYAVRASFLSLHELAGERFPEARLDSGELALREQGGGRLISTSLFTR
jgi:23S rRNA (cytosine1962-C5)-methyltransferase